jgi:superfamily II DNA helicase RecQ
VDEAEVDEEAEDVLELQSARTTAIGVDHYSVPIDIVKHLSVRLINAFRPLSTMRHRFLGLDRKQAARQETWIGDVDPSSSSRRRKKRERSGDDQDDGEEGRGLALQQSREKEKAICRAMQQVLGQQDVGFRSAEQERALHAVLDRQTPLVVVLLTGGGKSLLFSVPACMDDAGVTVVVVLY